MTSFTTVKSGVDLFTASLFRVLRDRMLENQQTSPGAGVHTSPSADPHGTGPASSLSFMRTGRIVRGTISDTCAVGGVYRVNCEGMLSPIVAYVGTPSVTTGIGPVSLTSLPVGTHVICTVFDDDMYGAIIGTTPEANSTVQSLQSILYGATRSRVDEAHKLPMRLGAPSLLGTKPYDSTGSGEAGWITETGLRICIDSFLAAIGVNEACGLTCHYHDMLARLAAYQFQLWTAAKEHESGNDQEECFDWTGYATYPWEQLGYLYRRQDLGQIVEPRDWQQERPYLSSFEPTELDAMPFHREREYHGYLGQGGHRLVVAPPISGDMLTFAGENDTPPICPGVFQEFVTLSGHYCLASTKGVSIAKRGVISAPIRRRKPEDVKGDTPENYKFSGQEGLGEGPEHKITGDFEFDDSTTHKNLARAAGVLDLHAYLFNYAGIHPFMQHTNDYYVPEEAEATWVGGTSAAVPNFGSLREKSYLDDNDFAGAIRIDHRYGMQNVYGTQCGIDLLEDGGVVIYDGYGGSIRMTGGQLEITAPGGVHLRGGTDVQLWAGHDIVLRSKGDVDITTTTGDITVKAENKLQCLAGNSGQGGILLESRSVGGEFDTYSVEEGIKTPGIILSAPRSVVGTWANNIYMRTVDGSADGGRTQTAAAGPAGNITLDAGRGTANVTTVAKQENKFLGDNGILMHFGLPPGEGGEEVPTLEGPGCWIAKSYTMLPGDAYIGGNLGAVGLGVFGRSLFTRGVIAAKDNKMFVNPFNKETEKAVDEYISATKRYLEETLPQDFGQPVVNNLASAVYAPDLVGNLRTIQQAAFALRSETRYRTETFVLYEDRWQQMARNSGQSLAKWEETSVRCQGEDTYPFPGRRAYDTAGTYLQQTPHMYDAANGRSKPRTDAAYQRPMYGKVTKATLKDYLIVG